MTGQLIFGIGTSQTTSQKVGCKTASPCTHTCTFKSGSSLNLLSITNKFIVGHWLVDSFFMLNKLHTNLNGGLTYASCLHYTPLTWYYNSC